MRLTNYIRDAFVKAACQDVPSKDYRQQAQDLVNKKAAEFRLKAGLPKDIDTRRLSQSNIWTPGSFQMGFTVHGLNYEEWDQIKNDPKLNELLKQHHEQADSLKELAEKLKAVAYSVSTRKALIELLPEFEKYLPAEAKVSTNLPAVSDVLVEFKRAGWPATKKRATEKQAATAGVAA